VADFPIGRLYADFNGLFGNILCLSHGDTCKDEFGQTVVFRQGMMVTAYDEDSNERGERDDLLASGTVEPSPDWLQCNGSRWVLKIDAKGVRRKSLS
jgi:hypothetical protein